jgi:hypothetical protein
MSTGLVKLTVNSGLRVLGWTLHPLGTSLSRSW